jgi:hypothetical protein
MTRPLGRHQLETLILCSSLTSILITTDKVSDSLVKRGLVKTDGPKNDG